jgi:carboxypeptidase PM20D1
MLRRLLLGLLALFALLTLVLAVNTFRKGSRQVQVAPAPALAVDEAGAAETLAGAIRARTVSAYEPADANADQFRALHAHLQQRFPRVHAQLQREVVADFTLVYTWPGRDAAAKPVALLAHQDVVPIAPGTEKDWHVDPFAGVQKEGFVWGRGAWDNKSNIVAQLQAVEMLLASGFTPGRTVYLVFGADEEVGGRRGAAAVAALLQQRGVRLDFVLDEGLLITEGVMAGLKPPTALIGIAEKGYMSVVLRASATPGHSSMPPPKGTSAVALLAASLKRLDDEQLPAGIRGVAQQMFDTIAPEMAGFSRVALSNLWLFGPLVQRQLEAGASTNAMLRTTTALTVVNAGNKDNVLPGRAEATVNFRLLPGDTREQVLAHVKQATGTAAERFELYALPGAVEASPVSPTDSAAYRLIERTVREVFPGTLVAPGLMIAATDSRHFAALSDHIFRFSPVRAAPQDLARFHGTNERIAQANLGELIRFYHRLLTQAAR